MAVGEGKNVGFFLALEVVFICICGYVLTVLEKSVRNKRSDVSNIRYIFIYTPCVNVRNTKKLFNQRRLLKANTLSVVLLKIFDQGK